MKILITGGHVTPALAVIDRIQERKLEHSIVFVGRKYISEKEVQIPSFEYKEVSSRNIPFIHLKTGRFTRIASIHSLVNLLQIPGGFISAFFILKKEKPNVILSFGGYLALPIAIVGKMMGIPVYTHEQTFFPGMANKYIAQFANTIFLSFPESALHFRNMKVVLSGNPVRKSIFDSGTSLIPHKDKPCIYVTGGSIGAHAVNTVIEKILAELLPSYYIIHQTGSVKEFSDFERLSILKKALPRELSEHYILQEHFSDKEIGSIYNTADLVVGRSGANTFFELIALKKPAVFIPLPWSANNEQEYQAKIFKEHRTGEVVYQNESPEQLLEAIKKVTGNLEGYKSHFESLSTYHTTNAADTIIDTIFKT